MFRASHSGNRADQTLSQLTPARQRFVALTQRLAFGTIHNLHIRAREPVYDPPPRVVRRKKNGGINDPRAQVDGANFALKREWIEFFRDLDAISDGVILMIEVAHGVPVFHEIEEVVR
jgi:hypothetical protein